MPMYKLLEYSNNYLKTSRGLCQYRRDEPALDNTVAIADFILLIHLNSKKRQLTIKATMAQKSSVIIVPL